MVPQRYQRLRRALTHAFASSARMLVGWFVVRGVQEAPSSADAGAGVAAAFGDAPLPGVAVALLIASLGPLADPTPSPTVRSRSRQG